MHKFLFKYYDQVFLKWSIVLEKDSGQIEREVPAKKTANSRGDFCSLR